MASNAAFAEVASLAGDPGRAGMLHALMGGRALTATELARVAGITPQTASGHLARLSAGGLVTVQQQGRHRYHRLASPAVARMLESIMQVAAGSAPRRKAFVGPRDLALEGRQAVGLSDNHQPLGSPDQPLPPKLTVVIEVALDNKVHRLPIEGRLNKLLNFRRHGMHEWYLPYTSARITNDTTSQGPKANPLGGAREDSVIPTSDDPGDGHAGW